MCLHSEKREQRVELYSDQDLIITYVTYVSKLGVIKIFLPVVYVRKTERFLFNNYSMHIIIYTSVQLLGYANIANAVYNKYNTLQNN